MKIILAAIAVAVTTAGSAAAFAPPSLTGIYVAKVAGKSPAQLNGTWYLAIEGGGLYTLQKKGVGVLVTGTAAVSGPKITFQKEAGPAACKGSQSVGRYTWALKGKVLTFKRIADTCVGRRTILSVPMKKTA